MMDGSGLLIDHVRLPLRCQFINCPAEIRRETIRILSDRLGSGFHNDLHIEQTDLAKVAPASETDLAIIGIAGEPREAMLKTVFQLWQSNMAVVCVGEPDCRNQMLSWRGAGAIMLVTNVIECGRLATVVQRLCEYRYPVACDWQSRFINRIPWRRAHSASPTFTAPLETSKQARRESNE